MKNKCMWCAYYKHNSVLTEAAGGTRGNCYRKETIFETKGNSWCKNFKERIIGRTIKHLSIGEKIAKFFKRSKI